MSSGIGVLELTVILGVLFAPRPVVTIAVLAFLAATPFLLPR